MMKRKKRDGTDHRAWLYRFLSSRPCTERDAERRLVRRGASPEEAAALAKEFAALGLIDDEAYARLFVEGHGEWGAERIRFELRRRGLSKEKAEAALEEAPDGKTDREKAEALVEAWLRQGLDWNKIAGRLARRGFSAATLRDFKKDSVEW